MRQSLWCKTQYLPSPRIPVVPLDKQKYLNFSNGSVVFFIIVLACSFIWASFRSPAVRGLFIFTTEEEWLGSSDGWWRCCWRERRRGLKRILGNAAEKKRAKALSLINVDVELSLRADGFLKGFFAFLARCLLAVFCYLDVGFALIAARGIENRYLFWKMMSLMV